MSAVAAEAGAVTLPDQRAYRLMSIDILRGLVIVVMALDHVRDYVMSAAVQDPLSDPSTGPLLFVTRWITHLCAPTFVFLAGTSAGLMARRKSPSALGQFLLTRGLWLVLVEVLVISTATSFAPLGVPGLGGRTYVGLQVIWAIGGSMIVLAGAQLLGSRACLVIGSVIVVCHNLLDYVWPAGSSSASTGGPWVALHARQVYEVGQFWIYFSYPLLPWIGVMLVGYASAGLFRGPADLRDKRLTRLGIGLVFAFVGLRALNLYGDPHPWHGYPGDFGATLRSFLATTKYPPSLSYLLMTLGPAAILCGCADRLGGWIKEVLATYGRAPLAFYIAHLYVIHAIALVLGMAQGFAADQFMTPYRFFPKDYGVPLGGVYLIWIAVVLVLFPLCRWVTTAKSRRTEWWLSYL
jgi:uncharacterized membrane protein